MSESADASAGRRYLQEAARLVERLSSEEWPNIEKAAEVVVATLERGGAIHIFGTGHSHILAEELFYRAGGLERVRPILFEGLMLHAAPKLSTSLERLPGLAAALLSDHPIPPEDVLIVASNSGGNAVVCELAASARRGGIPVIAIVSRRHASSGAARAAESANLEDLADVVIDNGGAVGDAAIEMPGFERRVGPTSTVVGAAIVNAVVAEAVDRLVARGLRPDVFVSSNVAGGDDANREILHDAKPG
ncbi:MAG: sugar isomerase domain-containing protein [Chloroflexota bacterium]